MPVPLLDKKQQGRSGLINGPPKRSTPEGPMIAAVRTSTSEATQARPKSGKPEAKAAPPGKGLWRKLANWWRS